MAKTTAKPSATRGGQSAAKPAAKPATKAKSKAAPSVPAEQAAVLKEFRTIPGVGKSIAEDFWNMGFRAVADLKGKDPEKLYTDFMALVGSHVDRCMLYVFRSSVYFAETPPEQRDKKWLDWWAWSDANLAKSAPLPRAASKNPKSKSKSKRH